MRATNGIRDKIISMAVEELKKKNKSIPTAKQVVLLLQDAIQVIELTALVHCPAQKCIDQSYIPNNSEEFRDRLSTELLETVRET